MVTFARDGSKLIIHADTGIPAVGVFPASFECGTGWAAELVVRALNKRMTDTLTKVRRESYEVGWKHAKAKKGGQHYFFGGW